MKDLPRNGVYYVEDNGDERRISMLFTEPRCRNCKHWEGSETHGSACQNIKVAMDMDANETVVFMQGSFGCVHFEAK